MGTVDSNGIYFYEESDPVAPLHTVLNIGQQSVSNVVTALNDSGWVNLPLTSGLTGECAYRVIGSLVEVTWDITGSIDTDAALTAQLPSDLRPNSPANSLIVGAAHHQPTAAQSVGITYLSGASGILRAAARGGDTITQTRGSLIYFRGA